MKFFFAGNIDDFYLCDFCNYELIYNEINASPDQLIPESGYN